MSYFPEHVASVAWRKFNEWGEPLPWSRIHAEDPQHQDRTLCQRLIPSMSRHVEVVSGMTGGDTLCKVCARRWEEERKR